MWQIVCLCTLLHLYNDGSISLDECSHLDDQIYGFVINDIAKAPFCWEERKKHLFI